MNLSHPSSRTIVKCRGCGWQSLLISQAVELCPDCLRSDFPETLPFIEAVHQEARKPFGLPARPPRDEGGKQCNLCVNQCLIGPGGRGYCGLRQIAKV